MSTKYYVELVDPTSRDKEDNTINFPLNIPYGVSNGKLTFAGPDIAESPLLSDIRIYFIMFWKEPHKDPVTGGYTRGEWSDPLRIDALSRLVSDDNSWYFGFTGEIQDHGDPSGWTSIKDDFRSDLRKILKLPFTIIQSEKPPSLPGGQYAKIFIETPKEYLPEIYRRYWPWATPGTPIEGYLMSKGDIGILEEWGQRPRDDSLFREVMDRVNVAFFTYDDENDHIFVCTNKFTLQELAEAIDLRDLNERAEALSSR